jgi:hypothetical protein
MLAYKKIDEHGLVSDKRQREDAIIDKKLVLRFTGTLRKSLKY